MRKRVLLAALGVLLTLALGSFALYTRSAEPSPDGALALSASLDTGPVPVVSSTYDLSAHQTLSRVILLIRENYVDPARIKPYDMFLSALSHIEKAVPEVMVDDSQAPRRVKVSVGSAEQLFDLGGLDQLWEVTMALRDIFRFLQQHIVDAEQRRDVEYAAINGMLATLDPHSVLLKPESFDEVKLSTKGEFGGLGIVISIRDNSLTIISPIEGTPASRSGLRAKDKIAKIGEESTVNMSLEEAVQRLRGKPGSKVVIWVTRKGWNEPRRFQLTRAIIKIESVASELLASSIGYVRVKSFQNNTYDDLRTHLEKLRKKNKGELAGLILDLRNNPGGLLDQAIHISDRFIDRGPIVITVGEGNRKREVKQARFSGTDSGYPIAVLVNGGSASASEIVSGALQNHDRAVVIGQQTFGKGSVQVLYDFKDQSALKLTIAQYLTPGDISIQSVGITPDVEIVPATVSKEAIRLFGEGSAPREKDLDKHLEQHGDAGGNGDRPRVHITHFIPAKELEGGPTDEEEEPNTFRSDFEIEVAQEMLAQANGIVSSRDLLEKANELFKRKAADQEGQIAKELSALGVDWSVGPPAAGSALVEATLATGAASGGALAGETIDVEATVKNAGDATLHQVFGVTESDNPLLSGLEFVFGKLPPGATRSWKVQVKVPADISSRGDRVTLSLGDADHVTDGTNSETFLVMRSRDRPRLSYTAWIDDAGGNGDGVLQVGESADLQIEVNNLGPGDATEVLASCKNLSGEAVFLETGRDTIGAIAAGESKRARMAFSVRDAASVAELRMSVWDNELGSGVSEKLSFPVLAARKGRADARNVRSGDGGAPIHSGADEATPVLGSLRAGAVAKSDLVFGDWRRVVLDDERFGFVREADVEVQRPKGKGGDSRPAGSGSTKGFVFERGQAPPSLKLDFDSYVTSAENISVQGTIVDETGLEDVFVFVGEKKVFYRSLKDVAAEGGTFSVPLSLSLPLKVGANAVAVVVRESEDLVSREVFSVYRDELHAVAERADEPVRVKHP